MAVDALGYVYRLLMKHECEEAIPVFQVVAPRFVYELVELAYN